MRPTLGRPLILNPTMHQRGVVNPITLPCVSPVIYLTYNKQHSSGYHVAFYVEGVRKFMELNQIMNLLQYNTIK